MLSEYLALKGGTAINLTILDLPRLSVDIDLDFSKNISREEMLEVRNALGNRIGKYMEAGADAPASEGTVVFMRILHG